MGMRMMFIVFLLVALATTVGSFTSDRASDGRNAAVNNKASHLIDNVIRDCCGVKLDMCHPCLCNNSCKQGQGKKRVWEMMKATDKRN
uniref:Conotoxin superfamily A n=1 Tax=Conus ermineus TaxID=55423 RepID=A0A346CIT3_CONER|nr:conotoxin precursor superfamily A [Conus ermineus]